MLIDKCAKTSFDFAWFLIVMKDAKDIFQYNFQAGLNAYTLVYRGVNLKAASLDHKEAKAMAKVIMKANGHVGTSL